MRPKIWDKLSVNIDHVYCATMWVCVCKDEQPTHTQYNHICVCSSVVYNPQLFSNTSTVYIRRQWIWTYIHSCVRSPKIPLRRGVKRGYKCPHKVMTGGLLPPPHFICIWEENCNHWIMIFAHSQCWMRREFIIE